MRWPNRMKSSHSESESRHSGRSDNEGSWRRRNSSDNEGQGGYASNSSYSAFSHSESETEQPRQPRYRFPNTYNNNKYNINKYESDGSDNTPRSDIRVRRTVGRASSSSPVLNTSPQQLQHYDRNHSSLSPHIQPLLLSSSSQVSSPPLSPPLLSPVGGNNNTAFAPSAVDSNQQLNNQKDWVALWSKVIILFQVLAIMAIVYFYNRSS